MPPSPPELGVIVLRGLQGSSERRVATARQLSRGRTAITNLQCEGRRFWNEVERQQLRQPQFFQ